MMALLALKPKLFSDSEPKRSVTLHSAKNSVRFCKKNNLGKIPPPLLAYGLYYLQAHKGIRPGHKRLRLILWTAKYLLYITSG